MTHFPIVADPATKLALLVPSRYWPAALLDEWKANTAAVVARLENAPVVALTPAAAEQVRANAAEQRMSPFWLRVGITQAGGGFQYAMDLVTHPPDPRRDLTSDSHSVPVIVDRAHRVYLDGTIIDHQDTLAGRGFVFKNPNATR